MAIAIYPAIIEHARKSYSVYFPDLPGCTSAGDSLQEAALNAEEALAFHLLGLASDGDAIAEPSSLDDIERDPEVDEAARILVRAEIPGRSIRINVTLDEGLVAAIDKIARNRSGFLADAARDRLDRQRETAAG